MKKHSLFIAVVCALLAINGYSAYRLWEINQTYAQEAHLHDRLMLHKPAAEVGAVTGLQAAHSDAAGWITIPNTKVDYPFAQGKDNAYYLDMDLEHNQAAAGTIFMDYRNSRDFTDFNTILYGHNMKNGSMFGSLQEFSNKAFFDANRTGTIILADKTYQAEFFAFAVIKPDNAAIYNPLIAGDRDKTAFLEALKSAAHYYRDIEIGPDGRIVTLSTCSYEFNNARMVLVGKLTQDGNTSERGASE